MKHLALLLCVAVLAEFCTVECCIEDEIANMKKIIVKLSRQLKMQQLIMEEHVRSSGSSGVKGIRRRFMGNKPYHSESFSQLNVNQIHDHANHRSTQGLGELIAVLNGVEFRTRHNDFMLNMPSTTSSAYHAVQPIEFPPVPPNVTEKVTVEEQIEEMREWFRAFKELNHEVRDYRPYFKPVLCYMEGAWVKSNGSGSDGIEEPFKSDRHFVNAFDKEDLERKIHFMAKSGAKNNAENYAFLPTIVYDVVDGEPQFATWHYRILCHPLEKYLKPDRMRVIDDLAPRLAFQRTATAHKNSRAARFQLNINDSNIFVTGHYEKSLLDDLMYTVPGKDNYGAVLRDSVFGLTSHEFSATESGPELNAANYHRVYQVAKSGANGNLHRLRGFNDGNVFMAMTTQPNVVTSRAEDRCRFKYNERRCPDVYEQKWTYAIPLEILYLTPLYNWNPFNIHHNDMGEQCDVCKGGLTVDTAYNCTTNRHFYRTPSTFFKSVINKDDGDTSGKTVGVLNKDGQVCPVKASGMYIELPEIEGVGTIRLRYPISPVQQDGEASWKEVHALKDLLFNKDEKVVSMKNAYDDMMDMMEMM